MQKYKEQLFYSSGDRKLEGKDTFGSEAPPVQVWPQKQREARICSAAENIALLVNIFSAWKKPHMHNSLQMLYM